MITHVRLSAAQKRVKWKGHGVHRVTLLPTSIEDVVQHSPPSEMIDDSTNDSSLLYRWSLERSRDGQWCTVPYTVRWYVLANITTPKVIHIKAWYVIMSIFFIIDESLTTRPPAWPLSLAAGDDQHRLSTNRLPRWLVQQD